MDNCLKIYLPSVIKRSGFGSSDIFFIEVRYFDLCKVLFFLKNFSGCQYKILTDLTAIDYIFSLDIIKGLNGRFCLIYNLLSISRKVRLLVKVFIHDFFFSVTAIFKSAGWLEREVWDMFGIFFLGHLELRRILTDYGFSGHPLRKDFPLSGFLEVHYSEGKKRVIYEPLELIQEYRDFKFNCIWV